MAIFQGADGSEGPCGRSHTAHAAAVAAWPSTNGLRCVGPGADRAGRAPRDPAAHGAKWDCEPLLRARAVAPAAPSTRWDREPVICRPRLRAPAPFSGDGP